MVVDVKRGRNLGCFLTREEEKGFSVEHVRTWEKEGYGSTEL